MGRPATLAAKYDLTDQELVRTVLGVIHRQLVDAFVRPTTNDPWGELSRLSFDELCRRQ